MGPPKRFGAGGGGGKKGPRAHKGSFKNKTVKLRPAPEKSRDSNANVNDDATSFPGEFNAYSSDEEDVQDGNEGGGMGLDEFNYREGLKGESKPLEGKSITVTGCGIEKTELLQIAASLGAKVEAGLTNTTTHLVADVPGSAKYETAVKLRLKIMHPEWIREVHAAWKSAEEADYDDLEERWVMKALFNTTMSITRFEEGTYRKNLISRIRAHGGTFMPSISVATEYLIHASTTSPHTREPESEKIETVLNAQRKGHNIKIVWEGWLKEVIREGGIREDRVAFWSWRGEGSTEPVLGERARWERPRGDFEVEEAMDVSVRRVMDVYGDDRGEEDDEEERVVAPVAAVAKRARDEVMVPKARGKARLGRNGNCQGIDSLLDVYNPSQSTSTSINAITTTTLLPTTTTKSIGLTSVRLEKVEMAMELSEDKVLRMGAKGKSVIKALSTSRSKEFIAPDQRAPRNFASTTTISRHVNPFRANAGVADDSAFFEESFALREYKEGEDEEAPVVPCFEGHKFVLVGTEGLKEGTVEKVREAIVMRKGTVLELERVDEADWICVPFASPPIEYSNSDDPRVASFAWIESCCYWEAFMEPGQGLLERPIPYDVPVPGGDSLQIALSGFDELQAAQLARFVQALGGTTQTEYLDDTCSHLVHAAFDTPGAELDGRKAPVARKMGIPIVGVEWVKEFGKQKAAEREEAEKEARRKGKGKEKVKEVVGDATKDATNIGTTGVGQDSRDSFEGSRSQSLVPVPLTNTFEGCTILVATKCPYDAKPLNALVVAHGGIVASSLTTLVTHLVHASSKVNEAFAQFKNAKKSGVAIVHPRWLEESAKRGELLNEGDFPHTFDPKKGAQLLGIISSPPKDRTMSRVNSAGSNVVQEDVLGPASPSKARSPSKSAGLPPNKAAAGGDPLPADVDAEGEGELQYYEGAGPATAGSQQYDEHDVAFIGLDVNQLLSNPSPSASQFFARDASEAHIPVAECGNDFNSTVDRTHTTATTPSHHDNTDEAPVEVSVCPASSSSPRRAPVETSSSPPPPIKGRNSNLNPNSNNDLSSDDPPIVQPRKEELVPRPLSPGAYLRQQTAVMNAQLAAVPIQTVEEQRRAKARSMARKRSVNSENGAGPSVPKPVQEEFHFHPPNRPAGPRRIPGMGMVESSQPSQLPWDDYSIDVRYEDPAAKKAQAALRDLLGLDKLIKEGHNGKRGVEHVDQEVQVQQESIASSKTPRKGTKASKYY